MPSPYVRRRRLAAELRKIREERDMTADELARFVYQSRTKITRLENGQVRPDLAEIMDMLDRLGVTSPHYEKIIRLARDAAEKGWWDAFGDSMGPRQRLYADLESGANTIRDYDPTGIPAVLQTPEFVAALIELDQAEGAIKYVPARMTDARLHRQRRLLGADGPTYDTVLDEFVIRRLDVPPAIMISQLRHMVEVVAAQPQVIVRFLPYDARITGGLLPKSSFALYTFPDPKDPPMAVVETIATELIHTEEREVTRYSGHYERLQRAALSPTDSLTFLGETAARLAADTERGT